MKKIFIMFVALWMGGCLLLSQSITVTTPTSGEKYKFGDTILIDWTSVGITGDVKVTLWFSDKSSGKTLVYPCPYDSSPILYTIHPGVISAGDYFIRVKHDTSNVIGESGVFSIESGVDLLEGTFSIAGVSYGTSGKTINVINVLVDYDAKKDFVICKTLKGKCNDDLGSMIVTYTIKNRKWQNDQVVDEDVNGCTYACFKSCATIYYPTAVQKAGKGSFLVTIYPKINNELNGILKQECIGGGWSAYDLMCPSYYYPELTVTLTLCTSYIDPPQTYKYKMISASSSQCCIWLPKADMQIAGDTDCGW